MNSSRPYLIRAIYEWIVDNNLTPYITVDTSIAGTAVPKEYIEDERIVLDISPLAVSHLIINNNALEFKARFKGIRHDVYVPTNAIMIIYAKENNQGMAFPPEEFDNEAFAAEDRNQETITISPKDGPQLQLVTGGKGLDTNRE